jgi:hypothetical protein
MKVLLRNNQFFTLREIEFKKLIFSTCNGFKVLVKCLGNALHNLNNNIHGCRIKKLNLIFIGLLRYCNNFMLQNPVKLGRNNIIIKIDKIYLKINLNSIVVDLQSIMFKFYCRSLILASCTGVFVLGGVRSAATVLSHFLGH